MRTTLDIHPRVLAAARARVSHGTSRSLGDAVSELALAGLDSEVAATSTGTGLILLPSTPGHVVTDEMVAAAMLDD